MRIIILLASIAMTSGSFCDPLFPSYPSVPPAYENLNPSSMVNKARVTFEPVVIERTDGFTVTDPDGNTFVVDNIEQPRCAFYASYVDTGDDPFGAADMQVISNVYVQEVNFQECR